MSFMTLFSFASALAFAVCTGILTAEAVLYAGSRDVAYVMFGSSVFMAVFFTLFADLDAQWRYISVNGRAL